MKHFFLFILFTFIYLVSFSQTEDTIKVFDYSIGREVWKINILNNKNFELIAGIYDDTMWFIKGTCNQTDSTINFIYDTSDRVTVAKLNGIFPINSNVGQIILGTIFKKQNNWIIPF
ncbi:MAG: hypothetical protein ACQUYJ_11090, partial [Ferruginibacter sp.]